MSGFVRPEGQGLAQGPSPRGVGGEEAWALLARKAEAAVVAEIAGRVADLEARVAALEEGIT